MCCNGKMLVSLLAWAGGLPIQKHRRELKILRLLVPVTVLLWVTLLDSAPGSAYRWIRSFDEDSLIPRSDTARQWRESVWGPGDTLVWHVLDDPLWLPHFSGPEETLPLVEESLDIWARIPGADVRWRVDRIVSGEQARGDGRNTVSVEETEDFAGQARRWSRRRRGEPWQTEECDVVLSADYLERLAGSHDNRLSTLLHEFGHCLGLQHAVTTPTIRWDWRWTDSSVWQKDPQMSYGRDIDRTLTEDDAIGASLLRPASGWLRTTGSISEGFCTAAVRQPSSRSMSCATTGEARGPASRSSPTRTERSSPRVSHPESTWCGSIQCSDTMHTQGC